MPGLQSINGVVSGLSTDEIISKIMQVEKRPITNLQNDQKELTTQLSAWQEFNTRLLALQAKATAIATPTQFDSRSVDSSDEDILTATAGSTAAPGTYYIKVTSTAQSHQLASQGFADLTDAVGVGTLTISLANGKETSITIDENSNSLAGLRDAINKSDCGVTAVIVNTGDADTPYKLLLTSDNSGTDYAMTVDTSGLDNPDRPAMNQVVQAATNAVLEMGTGAGKITITKSTNTINDFIPGLILNLKQSDADTTVTLKVNVDTEAMRSKITDFATQYNNLVDFFDSQFAYDPSAEQIGVLFGDFSLQILQSDLTEAIVNPIAGLTQNAKALSQIGLTIDQQGKLAINASELQDALDNKLDQVRNVFSTGFESDSASVSYISNTTDTKPSPEAGYSVVVTQAALQARVTSGVAQAGALSQDETLIINGSTILLEAGWTQAQVIAKINESTKYTGVKAAATGAGGIGTGDYLTLSQVTYGSAAHITAKSNTSSASGTNSGLGNVEVTETAAGGESGIGTGAAGQNMIGTINGVEAQAQGQYLIGGGGADGKNGAKGLKIRVEATTPLTTTIHFTKGVAALVRDLALAATESEGVVTTAENGINTEIDEIKKQIEDWNTRLADKEERLYKQFNAMEDALNKLQTQAQSIAALLSGSTTQ